MLIVLLLILFLIISYMINKIFLSKEEKFRTPLGQIVKVDGHNMSVYVEGKGNHTLVFLSGGGKPSPILDFKSLFSLLSNDYRIVVIEKFGYGFSDVVNTKRDIDNVLRQSREALDKAGISGPYILCPHSMSGIEALYWAQKYPEEVKAIVGLDMAVPEYYDVLNINLPLLKVAQYVVKLGLVRWIPGVYKGDAVRYGNLTEHEKEINRAVFYNRIASAPMINEAGEIKKSAKLVEENGVPQVPMLVFVSNGSGGTNFDEKTWRNIQKKYISKIKNVHYIELDSPHYVHNYAYKEISGEIKSFIRVNFQ